MNTKKKLNALEKFASSLSSTCDSLMGVLYTLKDKYESFTDDIAKDFNTLETKVNIQGKNINILQEQASKYRDIANNNIEIDNKNAEVIRKTILDLTNKIDNQDKAIGDTRKLALTLEMSVRALQEQVAKLLANDNNIDQAVGIQASMLAKQLERIKALEESTKNNNLNHTRIDSTLDKHWGKIVDARSDIALLCGEVFPDKKKHWWQRK